MKRILCLSAPPFSGKDTAAQAICSTFYHVKHIKYSRILKERTHALYGLTVPWDFYEGPAKDNIQPEFMYITPRQAYINVSEMLMKPVHGMSVWSHMLIDEIKKSPFEDFVISDCGFQTEWDDLVAVSNFKTGIIHITRPDCTYQNDSRTPIKVDKAHLYSWETHNNGNIDEYIERMINIAQIFYGE